MKITYYMPFKPPEHANPSGDLITGRELREFLQNQGHSVDLASTLRSRWIYWKPWNYLNIRRERAGILAALRTNPADLWLTYHSYYKAPDLLGPACSKNLKIPYVIFQGIYSTKRRRRLQTLPGFLLNRAALLAADLVVTNKKKDGENLLRLLDDQRVRYVPPGLRPDQFSSDAEARKDLREAWNVGPTPVILSAAMLRSGVKSTGIRQLITSCRDLQKSARDFVLVIVGDGRQRAELEQNARQALGSRCLFVGRVPRQELYRYYSAADLFAFPGIEESLGMVYLEAQAAGLPVVAFHDWGASEAVLDGQTGLLTPASQPERFTSAIGTLLSDVELRKKLGRQAREHVIKNHDLEKNYRFLDKQLHATVRQKQQTG